MLDSWWYLGVLLAGIAAHLVVLYGTYRRQQAASEVAADGDGDTMTVENGVITCPDCGAANDADYRHCGGCATQLPHAGALNQQDARPRVSLFG